jgi:chromosome segregation ATPase
MKDTLIKKIQDLVVTNLSGVYDEIAIAEEALDGKKKSLESVTAEIDKATQELSAIRANAKATIDEATKRNQESNLREQTSKKEEERVLNLREVINSEVKVGQDKIAEMTNEIKELSATRKQMELAAIAENDERIKELRAELEARVPLLNQKEKELKDKESNLAIVESRWKKLFGDKGLGFKV